MGPKRVPTRGTRAHVSRRAEVALQRVVVGHSSPRTRLCRGQVVPFWAGNAGIPVAHMRSRELSLQLGVGPRREIRGALVMAVGAETRARPIRLRQPAGLQVGCGPRHQGGDRPLLRLVTTGLRLHADVRGRLDQRRPLIAVDDPRGRLQVADAVAVP
jgi:hypothetical protein